MKQLRRWAIGLAIALTTLAAIFSLQLKAPAEEHVHTDLTLEAAGLTLEPLADGVYGLIASTDFPPADMATTAICNGGIIVGSEGVLVVDPFQNEGLANLLFEALHN